MDQNSEGPAIGIDLGTSYSCVGLWLNNRVQIISNDQGKRLTPSCVAFTNTGRFIGDLAENRAAMDPTNAVFDVKRLIGRRFRDPMVQKYMNDWPFKVIEGSKDKPQIVVTYKREEKHIFAEEISSAILIKMREIAEAHLGTKVKNAVVCVPASFNSSQRKATKNAGGIAGLNILKITNEPTAAAIAYGLDKKDKDTTGTRKVVMFDLGGGTCDVSILTIENDTFQVKATCGDTYLGGVDFDNRMVNHFVEKLKTEKLMDISGNTRALRKLRIACERAKRDLSVNTDTTIHIDSLYDDVDFHESITRNTFEKLNEDLFEKCKKLVKTCLEDANMDADSIGDVVLVGGSTRIPKVQRLLQELFHRDNLICKSINPDEAVAYGAAVHAAMLSRQVNENVPNLKLSDVIPMSLGWSLRNNFMHVMIPRNTTIPSKNEKVFPVRNNSLVGINFKTYEGESLRVSENNFLGNLLLSAIPSSFGPVADIKVCFYIDDNGISNFTAEATNHRKRISLEYDDGSLSEKEIGRLIEQVQKLSAEEEEFKQKVKAKNDLENYAYKVRKEFINSELLPEAKKEILDAIEEIICWLDGKEPAEEVEYAKRKEKIQSLEMNARKHVSADVDHGEPSDTGVSPMEEESIDGIEQENPNCISNDSMI